MKELVYDFCEFAGKFYLAIFLTIGIIALAIWIKNIIQKKIRERRRIEEKAIERYVQYRINRYIHKGY